MNIFIQGTTKNSSVSEQSNASTTDNFSEIDEDIPILFAKVNKNDNFIKKQTSEKVITTVDSTTQQSLANNLEKQYEELSEEYKKTKNEQGIIGNFWNSCKNNIGVSKEGKSNLNPLKWWGTVCNKDNGSDNIDRQIDELGQNIEELKKNPEKTAEIYKKINGRELTTENLQKIKKGENILDESNAGKSVKGFKEGQATAVDCTADLISGMVSFGGYTLAIAGGIAAPFTAGVSLTLVAAGLAIATGAGAITKVGIKSLDAYTGDRKYNSLGYDAVTGGINGILAPVTAGLGGTAGKTVASRLGVTAMREGIDLSVEQMAKEGIKAEAMRTITSTGNKYVGGTFISRSTALATEMAVDGSVSGALDNSTRHIAQTGSLKGTGQAFVEGAIGGLILSPVIGGGLRTAGKMAKPAADTSNIFRKASATAKENALNTPAASESALFTTIKSAGDDIMGSSGSADKMLKNSDKIIKFLPDDFDPTILGVGPSKLFQTLANENALDDETRKLLSKTLSSLKSTRTINDAQNFADELYGKGTYTIKGVGENNANPLGVGTIGEAYLAISSDNQEVVIKMIKEGVSKESLETEKQKFRTLIEKSKCDENDKNYRIATLEGLYDAWIKETDFDNEYQGGISLNKNAKSFSVAKPIDKGVKDGKCVSLVLEKAEGIQLEKLEEMIKLYKTDPKEFSKKYASEIEKYPWLKNMEKVCKESPNAYDNAKNEQILIPKGEENTMHGDPHEGNAFMYLDQNNNKLKLQFIDTGLTITRSSNEVRSDLSLGLAAILGNTEVLTKNILKNAQITNNSDKDKIAEKFANMLDEKLYNARIDLRDSQNNQNVINSIAQELGIVFSPNDAAKLKATVQAQITYKNLCEICDTKPSMIPTIKNLFKGISKSIIQNPVETLKILEETSSYIYHDPEKALRCFLQMTSK